MTHTIESSLKHLKLICDWSSWFQNWGFIKDIHTTNYVHSNHRDNREGAED
jgi:hypothetical protein